MKFSSGALLTLSSGIMCAEHFQEVHQLMEVLLRRPVYTHEMPRYEQDLKRLVIQEFPWLSDIEVPEGPGCEKVVQAVNVQYGKMHELSS